MRTLAITQNLSADGSPEFLGDWFDPTSHAPDLNEEVLRQSEAEDVLLLGRQTFEDFRSFWPQQSDDRSGIAAHLDRVHKVVVSTTLGDPEWTNSTVVGAQWRDRVRDLKAQDGGDVVCTGSLTLCPALIETGLVDEYRLFTFPAVQGRGRRLFPDGFEARLELVESRSFSNGVVLTRYRVSGSGS
ncbi:dihydrofolate reductase [Nocardioides anomalus]|uniref:Dihydrofolate reductase n=1 Tax=Nocardioides anomalus TaxID=2712223 RepID=A0A6G6WJH3_9ACTN|nr:dihydrofolate reductase family protein [Nocardioides anomalus]QIG45356.1 dihydrofolate reductase [Nocardioides anomalus]